MPSSSPSADLPLTAARLTVSDTIPEGGDLPSRRALSREKSPQSIARILIRNRRKRYLDTHPDYFESASLELADPLAYDRLVRRFQSASEREAEGRRKGYSGVLEADLWRSEAKVEALAHPDQAASMRYVRDRHGEIVAEDKDEVPISKEEGWSRWRVEMEMRFVRGEDEEFDYSSVDQNEEFDDRNVEEREQEEAWFDDEDPSWVKPDDADSESNDIRTRLVGQTGIQDF